MSIKDAEIARLKAEAESLVEQFRSIRELCYSKDKIITDLADLIDQGFGPSGGLATYKFRLRQASEKARREVDHEQ